MLLYLNSLYPHCYGSYSLKTFLLFGIILIGLVGLLVFQRISEILRQHHIEQSCVKRNGKCILARKGSPSYATKDPCPCRSSYRKSTPAEPIRSSRAESIRRSTRAGTLVEPFIDGRESCAASHSIRRSTRAGTLVEPFIDGRESCAASQSIRRSTRTGTVVEPFIDGRESCGAAECIRRSTRTGTVVEPYIDGRESCGAPECLRRSTRTGTVVEPYIDDRESFAVAESIRRSTRTGTVVEPFSDGRESFAVAESIRRSTRTGTVVEPFIDDRESVAPAESIRRSTRARTVVEPFTDRRKSLAPTESIRRSVRSSKRTTSCVPSSDLRESSKFRERSPSTPSGKGSTRSSLLNFFRGSNVTREDSIQSISLKSVDEDKPFSEYLSDLDSEGPKRSRSGEDVSRYGKSQSVPYDQERRKSSLKEDIRQSLLNDQENRKSLLTEPEKRQSTLRSFVKSLTGRNTNSDLRETERETLSRDTRQSRGSKRETEREIRETEQSRVSKRGTEREETETEQPRVSNRGTERETRETEQSRFSKRRTEHESREAEQSRSSKRGTEHESREAEQSRYSNRGTERETREAEQLRGSRRENLESLKSGTLASHYSNKGETVESRKERESDISRLTKGSRVPTETIPEREASFRSKATATAGEVIQSDSISDSLQYPAGSRGDYRYADESRSLDHDQSTNTSGIFVRVDRNSRDTNWETKSPDTIRAGLPTPQTADYTYPSYKSESKSRTDTSENRSDHKHWPRPTESKKSRYSEPSRKSQKTKQGERSEHSQQTDHYHWPTSRPQVEHNHWPTPRPSADQKRLTSKPVADPRDWPKPVEDQKNWPKPPPDYSPCPCPPPSNYTHCPCPPKEHKHWPYMMDETVETESQERGVLYGPPRQLVADYASESEGSPQEDRYDDAFDFGSSSDDDSDLDELLQPVEDLKISVPKEDVQLLGKVTSIVGCNVIVEPLPNLAPVDLNTVLFLEEGKETLGRIEDVFGPVTEPMYVIRFNTVDDIKKKNIKQGTKVYYAPTTEHTKFVHVSEIMKKKGSDASWKHNQEVPEELLDFSDDEEEAVRLGKAPPDKSPKLGKRQWQQRDQRPRFSRNDARQYTPRSQPRTPRPFGSAPHNFGLHNYPPPVFPQQRLESPRSYPPYSPQHGYFTPPPSPFPYPNHSPHLYHTPPPSPYSTPRPYYTEPPPPPNTSSGAQHTQHPPTNSDAQFSKPPPFAHPTVTYDKQFSQPPPSHNFTEPPPPPGTENHSFSRNVPFGDSTSYRHHQEIKDPPQVHPSGDMSNRPFDAQLSANAGIRFPVVSPQSQPQPAPCFPNTKPEVGPCPANIQIHTRPPLQPVGPSFPDQSLGQPHARFAPLSFGGPFNAPSISNIRPPDFH